MECLWNKLVAKQVGMKPFNPLLQAKPSFCIWEYCFSGFVNVLDKNSMDFLEPSGIRCDNTAPIL